MLYLDTNHLRKLAPSWRSVTDQIVAATRAINDKDFAQPKKPYLRFRDPVNRIIAMPAFVGGPVDSAGLKWIASFPNNTKRGLARAHSITILNDADTGVPTAVINSALISEIRTAGVSGAVMNAYLNERGAGPINVGIVGLGPIGVAHLQMLTELFGDRIQRVSAFDIRQPAPTELPESLRSRVQLCTAWADAYNDADVFITATVSPHRYIDRAPKPGSLHLNVSLRDYQPHLARAFDVIAVDSWDEVCRENTDIEVMHREMGLGPSQVLEIGELLAGSGMRASKGGKSVMFNPMGMAAFDVAVGVLAVKLARAAGIGTSL